MAARTSARLPDTETTRTFACVASWPIAAIAGTSEPRYRSSMTTSVPRWRPRASSSSTELAEATTRMSLRPAKTCSMPQRATGWSSTTATRMGQVRFGASMSPPFGPADCAGRGPQLDGGAGAGHAVDPDGTADLADACDQRLGDATAAAGASGVEATALIQDADHDRIILAGGTQHRLGHPRVLADVGQRFPGGGGEGLDQLRRQGLVG